MPERNNVGFTSASYDLTGLEVGSEGMQLQIKIYGLATAKEYGFANVVVDGNALSEEESKGITSVTRPAKYTVYYTLDGRKTIGNQPWPGINIVHETVNGESRVYKIMK